MTKTISFGLLLLTAAQCALAVPTTAPEIDPGSAMTGLTLLAGAMLVLRGRRLKK
jgi:hypothetical protein